MQIDLLDKDIEITVDFLRNEINKSNVDLKFISQKLRNLKHIDDHLKQVEEVNYS